MLTIKMLKKLSIKLDICLVNISFESLVCVVWHYDAITLKMVTAGFPETLVTVCFMSTHRATIQTVLPVVCYSVYSVCTSNVFLALT
jgi:hypothetical protein